MSADQPRGSTDKPEVSSQPASGRTSTPRSKLIFALIQKLTEQIRMSLSGPEANSEVKKLTTISSERLSTLKKHFNTITDSNLALSLLINTEDTEEEKCYGRVSAIHKYLQKHFPENVTPWNDYIHIVDNYIQNIEKENTLKPLKDSSVLEDLYQDLQNDPETFARLIRIFREHGSDLCKAVFYCRSIDFPGKNSPEQKFNFLIKIFDILMENNPSLKGQLGAIMKDLYQSGWMANLEDYMKCFCYLYNHPDATHVEEAVKAYADPDILEILYRDLQGDPDTSLQLLKVYQEYGFDFYEAVSRCRNIELPEEIVRQIFGKDTVELSPEQKLTFLIHGFLVLIDNHPQLKGQIGNVIRASSRDDVINIYDDYAQIMWYLQENGDKPDFMKKFPIFGKKN